MNRKIHDSAVRGKRKQRKSVPLIAAEFDVSPIVQATQDAVTAWDNLGTMACQAVTLESSILAAEAQAVEAIGTIAPQDATLELTAYQGSAALAVVPNIKLPDWNGRMSTLPDLISAVRPEPAAPNTPLRPAARPSDREWKIYKVILQNVTDTVYCTELDRAGVAPRKTGKWTDCPRKYPTAYKVEHWRRRINEEKTYVRRKCEAYVAYLAYL